MLKSSVITEEVHNAFLYVLDYSMLHNITFNWLSSAHLEYTRQLGLAALIFFDQIHVGFLDNLNRIAEDFDPTLDLCDRLRDVVEIGVALFFNWLLG